MDQHRRGKYLALWPEGSELEIQGGSVTVVIPAGDILTAGTSIYVGGGEVTDREFLSTLLATRVPEACAGQPGWLVTEKL